MSFNEKRQMYPVNFNCQSTACRLLKNALKSQQSFDDTQQLILLINKLKEEINIIRI